MRSTKAKTARSKHSTDPAALRNVWHRKPQTQVVKNKKAEQRRSCCRKDDGGGVVFLVC